MHLKIRSNQNNILGLLSLCLFLTACGGYDHTPQPVTLPTATITQPSPTSTVPPPSPTPEPLAVLVNGEGITLAEYQAELARYNSSPGVADTGLADQANKRVLDDLIDQALLAQSAVKDGYQLDDTALQARVDQLSAQIGGEKALNDWISAHGYTETSFRNALKRAASAAWFRDKIVAGVPEIAEQIDARQILLYNPDQADQILTQLKAGTDFASLAKKYDPVNGGNLGWFPRGYLPLPELEKAAFALQEGQFSDVIKTRLGYHILQVIKRDPQHPLEPDALRQLQTQALQDWLQQQRSQSEIKVYLP